MVCFHFNSIFVLCNFSNYSKNKWRFKIMNILVPFLDPRKKCKQSRDKLVTIGMKTKRNTRAYHRLESRERIWESTSLWNIENNCVLFHENCEKNDEWRKTESFCTIEKYTNILNIYNVYSVFKDENLFCYSVCTTKYQS